ncbi:hypothetical protein L1987_02859 [Smallanthus sonchifolius]|uniref:Uncharacterized protein n=1 Tax=Smallanthus sonchifolius TaxID=185202 RepID=A0ACB9K900_9ASTR|nr:hypothetical protein L1987_02859 [Smallanthus sonchifolius]
MRANPKPYSYSTSRNSFFIPLELHLLESLLIDDTCAKRCRNLLQISIPPQACRYLGGKRSGAALRFNFIAIIVPTTAIQFQLNFIGCFTSQFYRFSTQSDYVSNDTGVAMAVSITTRASSFVLLVQFDFRIVGEEEKRKRDAEEMGDAMKSKENRTLDLKREMDILSALDEMKSMKMQYVYVLQSRHAHVSVDSMLEALQRSTPLIVDDELDDDDNTTKFSVVKKSSVSKRQDRKEEEKSRQSNGLESLCKQYDSSDIK